ncbi:MAG: glutamate--tRNA ligase [Bacteroidales bacterium]|jgi:glutamyl-tRNA synthetase|nr:glutamate--tRNA ligase [Bacteroidales bacterium]MCK9500194.1 glutamate--tRNA ligase [Bacteroidales bacterium]MDY0315197.1 glutamate--tRNA ligase [Bacteroidales bacterium]NLB87409.1 glutamate--tRNA ligase [Bacteroidales bacterium]
MVRVRFAPSPTGPLHMGGVRTALFNYLFAKSKGGKMILRIEDTDQTRFVEGAEEFIIESLEWCGIKFDEGIKEGGDFGPYRQSNRREIYERHAEILIENQSVYMAFDSAEDLDKLRAEAEANGKTFVYNYETRKSLKNSLALSKEEVSELLANKTPYVLRFKMPENRIIELHDEIRGDIKFNSNELDDKVLMKTDGLPTYHLANIVDDHLMEISHVIRGEEWLPSLALHYLLYEAFGWTVPKFAHLPLILKPSGKGKLSKRDGDQLGFPVFPIQWKSGEEIFRGYREDGYLPEAFINMLALLGWNPGTEQEIFSMDELIQAFSLDRVGKSASRFSPDKAKWFNHQYLSQKSGEEIAESYKKILDEKNINYSALPIVKICEMLKERLNFIHDLWDESFFFFQAPKTYDEKFLKKAYKEDTSELLNKLVELLKNQENFNAQEIENLVKTWLETEEIGFGKLMSPFRLALVGEGKGPHVFDIIEILGKEESIKRILALIEFVDNK